MIWDPEYCSTDTINPVEIEHCIDEIWIEGRLIAQYNLFDHHFEQGNTYCRARSYADEMNKVVVYGPFANHTDPRAVENGAFVRAVHAYLERRYLTVESG